jgi:D-amino-acid oxidase
LCNDTALYPVLGQVLIALYDHPIPNIAYDEGPNSLAYIIQRKSDVILGGTADPGVASLDVDEPEAMDIIRRCSNLVPGLEYAKIQEIKVGLRPGRKKVRVERDPIYPVVHNYGHGGSGFTLAWGCAKAVAKLLDDK